MFNSNGTSILKHIKKKGFITGHSNNICTRQLYDIEDKYTENIEYDNFDHENIAMMCDPNFYNPENRFTPYMGQYSIRRSKWSRQFWIYNWILRKILGDILKRTQIFKTIFPRRPWEYFGGGKISRCKIGWIFGKIW